MMLYTLYEMEGEDCLYDLSNGSLNDERIGEYEDIPIYSAERLLNDIEESNKAVIRRLAVSEDRIKWEVLL